MSQQVKTGMQHYIEIGRQKQQAEQQYREKMRKKRFDTIAAHGMYSLEEASSNYGSTMEPLVLSPAQHFENSDHLEAALSYATPAWGYTRIHNPSLHYLEETLSLLEGYGYDGETNSTVTSSGMSAIFMATQPFLEDPVPGVNFIADAKCYGGTFMLFNERYHKERNIDVRWIEDSSDLSHWEHSIDEHTRFLYVEMPSNPSLTVVDLEGLSALAHHHNLPLIVDATIATPALMRPLRHGADIVIHSLSKAIGGSGSAIAGAIIAKNHITTKLNNDDLKANFTGYLKLWPMRDHGPALSPMSAHFLLNDIRTLRTRVDAMSKNALTVAKQLESIPSVEAVYYPGLPSNAGHTTAKRYMQLVDHPEQSNRYGHLISFTVASGAQATRDTLDRLSLIWRATDLGRHKSVAVIPSISTHQQQGETGRSLASIPANLIRLSIGMEHPDDLMTDLEQALQ